MKTIMKACLLMSLLLSIGACATAPSTQELAVANYGDPPSRLEEVITLYLKETLKDPDSLKNLRIGIPRKGWTKTNYGKDVLYGHWVGFSYNAKNSYGGYVGQKTYCAFFQENYIRQVWSEDDCSLFVRTVE